mmetsp:Transcript_22064/g.75655  ORF Transcript_22064/g.75655 Transcript_22064/m.75655 type:complete len:260 (+) Transcript_22064:146-925(+)
MAMVVPATGALATGVLVPMGGCSAGGAAAVAAAGAAAGGVAGAAAGALAMVGYAAWRRHSKRRRVQQESPLNSIFDRIARQEDRMGRMEAKSDRLSPPTAESSSHREVLESFRTSFQHDLQGLRRAVVELKSEVGSAKAGVDQKVDGDVFETRCGDILGGIQSRFGALERALHEKVDGAQLSAAARAQSDSLREALDRKVERSEFEASCQELAEAVGQKVDRSELIDFSESVAQDQAIAAQQIQALVERRPCPTIVIRP